LDQQERPHGSRFRARRLNREFAPCRSTNAVFARGPRRSH